LEVVPGLRLELPPELPDVVGEPGVGFVELEPTVPFSSITDTLLDPWLLT
jgi:hypothetical protein